MKIAILHEMMVKLGGAEKVVESLMKIFPDADLFTLIYDEKKVKTVFPRDKINKQVFKLKSQKIYNLFKNQRLCLPFMPASIEVLDFSEYDVVLCSSSGFAHGAITKTETKFIVYYHSPTRYLWDWTNEYKKDIGWSKGIKGYVLNKLFLKLRIWDVIASSRVDITLANSRNTQSRIKKYYRKDSIVVYPPVEVDRFKIPLSQPFPLQEKGVEQNNYYIIISALTEFKKIEVAVEAFCKIPDKKLLVIGEGSFRKNLENLATSHNNINFVGAKYGSELVELIQGSSGLIFPGEEDFGIVPIEVMAAGKPVFAYKGGGLTETVLKGKTGEFFENKDGNDFVEKFIVFDKNNDEGKYTKEACIMQASKYSEDEFKKQIKKLMKL